MRLFKQHLARITITVIILANLMIISFFVVFHGYQAAYESWHVDGYRIDFVEDRGFASTFGHGDYVLNQYFTIPLLVKEIESVAEQLMEDDCKIQFTRAGIIFDKCEGKIDSGR